MSTTKPDRLKIGVNGCTLTAEKIDGQWRFKCKQFPDLEERRAESASATIEEFTSRALEPAAAVKKLAGGKR